MVGIILAAVPVFVFGFIVACCCLPVSHEDTRRAHGERERERADRASFGGEGVYLSRCFGWFVGRFRFYGPFLWLLACMCVLLRRVG